MLSAPPSARGSRNRPRGHTANTQLLAGREMGCGVREPGPRCGHGHRRGRQANRATRYGAAWCL